MMTEHGRDNSLSRVAEKDPLDVVSPFAANKGSPSAVLRRNRIVML